jgi:hypothetical protein
VDKKHHGEGTRDLARWFEKQSAASVGGFLEVALKNEKRILDTYFTAFKKFETSLSATDIRNERIIKNHAQIAACAQALTVVFPNLNQATIDQFCTYLGIRAKAREERIAADHPIIEKFWETFHYINDKGNVLDHSESKKEIAINLNSFRAYCIDYGQELIDLTQLKKILPSSKRYKFIAKNRVIRSKIQDKTTRCWIFQQ